MIEYVKRLAGPFTSEGQSRLPFGFLIFEKTDVYVATADDPEAQAKMLVYGQDYSVEMNADQTATPGGTVVLTTPIVKGNIFVVGSAVAYTQNMQLTNYSRFPPEIINEAMDRVVVQIQQIVELLGRCLKIPPTSSMSADELLRRILEVYALAQKVLEIKDEIQKVAGNAGFVRLVSENIDAVVHLADNLDKLLNIEELFPLIESVRENAEIAEASAKKAEAAAEAVKKFEELYPDFLRILEEASALLSSVDEVRLAVLNVASVSQAAFGRSVLREHYAWEIDGLRQIKYLADIALSRSATSRRDLDAYHLWIADVFRDIGLLSTTSLAAFDANRHAVEQYWAWFADGMGKIKKVGEVSLLTRRQNEAAIWAYDDEIRVKNMLIRSYVEKPYLLFIVAGQSNAVGTGPSPGYEDASYCGLYWDWKDQKAKSIKPLKDPVYRSFRGSAWPSFARYMFERTGRKTIILNIAWGGAAVTNINPSNSWYQDDEVVSLRRIDATREWTALLEALKASSIDYELAGMMWVQGEAECARIGAGTLPVQAYTDGTLDAFKYFRDLTSRPTLPIYMAQIGYYKLAMANPELLGGYEKVRKAQLDLCKEHEKDSIFMASELPGTYFKAGYMQDNIHYNQRGYNSLGASFARFISNHQSF